MTTVLLPSALEASRFTTSPSSTSLLPKALPTPEADVDRRLRAVGTVYCIQESVKTPIEDLFQNSCSNLDPASKAFYNSQTSLSYLSSAGSYRSRKNRPCILVKDDVTHGSESMKYLSLICLMATFEGTPIERMPFVFRHFSIPVFPSYAIDLKPSRFCIRASPKDWAKADVWVIAWMFQSSHPLQGTWTPQVGHHHRFFDSRTVAALVIQCEKKKKKWRSMCANRHMAHQYANEFREHLRTRREKQRSPKSSVNSFRSKYSSISNNHSRPSMGIWEDHETQSIHEVFKTADDINALTLESRDTSRFMAHLTDQLLGFAARRTSSSRLVRGDASLRKITSGGSDASSVVSAASGQPGASGDRHRLRQSTGNRLGYNRRKMSVEKAMGPSRKATTSDPSSSKQQQPSTSTPHKKSSKRPQHKKHPAPPPSAPNALPGVQKIKAALRQTRRLLAKDSLAADVRVATERRLKSLEADLAKAEQARLERTMATRYHKIKFFERQKVSRKLAQTKRKLACAWT
ncbi:hypothetical protein ONZ51_g11186 [Trametes cubensis]|uniref:rRNA-processing protein EFG1 n=1 Tax=Trametes cubensis TaxID=1111947 RepID=A0AAD7X836_9APHY|nr:hypothetical protein ONZ51_g11186 [Trametes cubensis]